MTKNVIIVLHIYETLHATRIMTKVTCNKAMAGKMVHSTNGQMAGQTKITLL